MPVTDDFHQLPLDLIHVDRSSRQRRELETKDLEKSISRLGVLQPILVKVDPTNQSHFILVAGERRLQACKNLGLPTIPARFIHELSPAESAIIELEENIKRTDLTMPDKVGAIEKIHNLHKAADPTWTAAQTADALSLSPSIISMYLTVAREIQAGHDQIKSASTIREAYDNLKHHDHSTRCKAINTILAGSPPTRPIYADSILQVDFLSWAPSYEGPKFNLLHCDFENHTDEDYLYFNLIENLCVYLKRLASVSCHILFWYSDRHKNKTLELFHSFAPQIRWQTYPLIWLKSNYSGPSRDPELVPHHSYETCLVGTIGTRYLIRSVPDAYACPTDNTLHPHTKPESMLRHFLSMFVDAHTTLLDPTCGSGAALRAAESLGAQHVLGLELNPDYHLAACQALRDFRTLRVLGV